MIALINNTFKKKATLLVFIYFISLAVFSQSKITIYKIDDLITRIEKNNDTLYVVNFWATWCKPCVAELPDFEKVNNEFKLQKVKVLLVSMDFKEEIDKRVLPFISKNNYSTEVVLLDETNGDFINKIHSDWSGAIPATLLIKNSKKIFIPKKINYEELKTKIISSQ
jgi:thiol-disulfide isomerase/thioredoxin